MGEQTSFTDDLYDVDIKVAELYKELKKAESRIHFLRTTVSAVHMKCQHLPKPQEKLSDVIRELTSALDWVSDLMFYLDGASCDIEPKSLDSYKKLRDMNNPVQREGRPDFDAMHKEAIDIRIVLFRVFDKYHRYVDSVKPCMEIYENLIDVVRGVAKKIKEL